MRNKPDKHTRQQTTEIGEKVKNHLARLGEEVKLVIDQSISQLEQEKFYLQQDNNSLEAAYQDLHAKYQDLHAKYEYLFKVYQVLGAEKKELNERFTALFNEYHDYKIAESGDMTFDSIKFREQFGDFKTQKFNAFVDQIHNLEHSDYNQEQKGARRAAIKEILTRNIFLKMNSDPLDIMDDIYKDLAWENLAHRKTLESHILQFIAECHELVRAAWGMTPQGKIFVYRKGMRFNPDLHEVPPLYKETGEITATLFPACLIDAKVLVKALVLTEFDDYSEDDFSVPERTFIPTQSESETADQGEAQEPGQEKTDARNQEEARLPEQEKIVTHDQQGTGEQEFAHRSDFQTTGVAALLTQAEEALQPVSPQEIHEDQSTPFAETRLPSHTQEETQGDETAPLAETHPKKHTRKGSAENTITQQSPRNEEGLS